LSHWVLWSDAPSFIAGFSLTGTFDYISHEAKAGTSGDLRAPKINGTESVEIRPLSPRLFVTSFAHTAFHLS
jgi:hypothetical protein